MINGRVAFRLGLSNFSLISVDFMVPIIIDTSKNAILPEQTYLVSK
jgi:hypothetical protein